jgi:hypothetical protein
LTLAWVPPWSYGRCFSDTGVPCGEGTWKIVLAREEKYTNVWRKRAKEILDTIKALSEPSR